jgi:hypothetical protein
VTSASGFVNTALASVQTGLFAVEFDATPSGDAVDMVVGLAPAAASAYADLATIVRFNTSGQIDARNGSGFAASQAINYTGGLT